MFESTKREVKQIAHRILHDAKPISADSISVCDGCQCLLYSWNAVKGKSEIIQCGSYPNHEHIKAPYYCHRCARERGLLKSKKGKKP